MSLSPLHLSGQQLPAKVATGSSVDEALAAGREYTCAILTDGRIFCWGRNDYGQLGNGSASGGSTTPVEVTF